MYGFLAVNKAAGITSYDVIRKIKSIIGKEKIGHAGTLDPFATGVLIIAIGKKFTKQLSVAQKLPKTYRFEMVFGIETDTLDCDGQEMSKQAASNITLATLEESTKEFVGEIKQLPPKFSAKKVNGKRAYKLAREGKEVQLEPATVTIHELVCHHFEKGEYPAGALHSAEIINAVDYALGIKETIPVREAV